MSFCLTELYLWSLKNTLHVGGKSVLLKFILDTQWNPGALEKACNVLACNALQVAFEKVRVPKCIN